MTRRRCSRRRAGSPPTERAPSSGRSSGLVENPLALELLEGRFAEDDTVRVDTRDGELVFERAEAATAATA